MAKIRNTRLYRAQILDREQRLLLLRRAKGLKDSRLYKSVYLQRDLTFRQRQEMAQRRESSGRSRSNQAARRGAMADLVEVGDMSAADCVGSDHQRGAGLVQRGTGGLSAGCVHVGSQRGRGAATAVCGAGSVASVDRGALGSGSSVRGRGSGGINAGSASGALGDGGIEIQLVAMQVFRLLDLIR